VTTMPIIDGYCAIWGSRVDAQCVRRGALKRYRRVAVTVSHALALELASPPQFTEDHLGIKTSTQLADTALSRTLIDAMRQGSFLSMSYSYRHAKLRPVWCDGQRLDVVVAADMVEFCYTASPRQPQAVCRLVSQPTWPADPQAYAKLIHLLKERQSA